MLKEGRHTIAGKYQVVGKIYHSDLETLFVCRDKYSKEEVIVKESPYSDHDAFDKTCRKYPKGAKFESNLDKPYFMTVIDYRLHKEKTYVLLKKSPAKIGTYEVISETMSGGMGFLYKVRDEAGKIFALKALLSNVKDNDEAKKRLWQEGVILEHMNHEHIVKGLDTFMCDGNIYLLMNYLTGKSLREIIPLGVKLALECTKQIAKAVSYLHSCGVVHRDIKPENIMIDERGNACLLDFGIAKILKEEAAGQKGLVETISGQFVGTIGYAAPERIMKMSEIKTETDKKQQEDFRSDIFSLGVIIYETITGSYPFLPKNIMNGSTADEICKTPLPEIPTMLSQPFTDKLNQLLRDMTEKDKNKRLQKMAEVVDKISELLQKQDLR